MEWYHAETNQTTHLRHTHDRLPSGLKRQKEIWVPRHRDRRIEFVFILDGMVAALPEDSEAAKSRTVTLIYANKSTHTHTHSTHCNTGRQVDLT